VWIGKGLDNLPTLYSLLTELFVLYSVCLTAVGSKYAHSWLSPKIKFISLLLWDVVQCRVAVFCITPVCATQHTRRKKIWTAVGKRHIAGTKFFMIATVLWNIYHTYKFMHDSSSSYMQVRTKRRKFSHKILSASLNKTF